MSAELLDIYPHNRNMTEPEPSLHWPLQHRYLLATPASSDERLNPVLPARPAVGRIGTYDSEYRQDLMVMECELDTLTNLKTMDLT